MEHKMRIASQGVERIKVYVPPVCLPNGRLIPGGMAEVDAHVVRFADGEPLQSGDTLSMTWTYRLD